MTRILEPESVGEFPEEHRRAIYEVISLRRDIRHFHPDREIPPDTLERILGAAHQAPSVGFSQPWAFILVRGRAIREHIRASFLRCREAEAVRFPPDRREAYLAHKLEGIVEAPLNVCVAVDLRSRGEAILGTTTQPEAVRASACCAIENLWLAARAEGIGVGWVSIVEPAVLRSTLELPAGIEPVGYLCLGYPLAFRARPMLEESGWRPRRALSDAIHPHGRWTEPAAPAAHPQAGAAVSHASIPPLDETARLAAIAHQRRLTKPIGSLGRLEELAVWYAAVRGRFPAPPAKQMRLAIFAGDHGVVVEGVSAYGSQLTAAMVCNVMAGGAAINALAGAANVAIELVDVGVAGDLSAAPTSPLVSLRNHKIRAGTANLRLGSAMTETDTATAIAMGESLADELVSAGADVVGVGEIGIGNTTAAAALVCALTGSTPDATVGRGTGIDDAVRRRKVQVVTDALALHRSWGKPPLEVLAALGGFEIAAMVGFILQAARRGMPVVLDGIVSNAAALVTCAYQPQAREYLLASHRSPEPGAALALDILKLAPLLELGMRLGEGTGAVLAMSILRSATVAQSAMATFETAGIVDRRDQSSL
jgi:nicotinate-nucleotide--dimethylbenzimidazole phosphoribosyltransferase